MAINRFFALLVLAVVIAALPACAQTTGKTVRHHRVEEQDPYLVPALIQAEKLIGERDYAGAEARLRHIVSDDDTNYRAWFDLGYVLTATKRDNEAIDAYRKSVAAKPDLFESNLNLGTLLGESGRPDAEEFLRAATKLRPSGPAEQGLERAWLSLGHVLEKKAAVEAANAYREAAKLRPEDAEPHLAAGLLFENQKQFAEAEAEYKKALEVDPNSREAVAGLINVYTRTERLPETEKMLRHMLKMNPENQNAHLQLGRVLMASGKSDEARTEYEAVLKLNPNDRDAQRELANADAAAGKYREAAERYQLLAQKNASDAELHYAWGNALMQAHEFRSAQQVLLETVKLKPDLAEVYGDLAVAANENKNYQLAIRALDARARFLPETPGTYFLRATSYDNLKAFPQAAENYRQFLAVAQGKFPEQEWQARHRLETIAPKKK